MASFTVSTLVERRGEIQREIAYLQHELKRCEEAIGHIDATIRLLDSCYDLAKLKPKQFDLRTTSFTQEKRPSSCWRYSAPQTAP